MGLTVTRSTVLTEHRRHLSYQAVRLRIQKCSVEYINICITATDVRNHVITGRLATCEDVADVIGDLDYNYKGSPCTFISGWYKSKLPTAFGMKREKNFKQSEHPTPKF